DGKNIKMAISNTTGVEIDTPEDLERANEMLREKNPQTINNKFRNFPMVPKVVFETECFDQLSSILSQRKNENGPFIFLVDDVFENNKTILDRIHLRFNDKIIFISAEEEPKTSQVDKLVADIRAEFKNIPAGIIGIGGGTVMDFAKAVSI